MVNIVVLGAGPEGEEVVQTPGELVTAVGIDGLEQAEHDPDVHGEDVQVTGDGAPENGRADSAKTKDHDFDGRGVLGGETEGCRILVVDFVDVLVEEAEVHSAVHPVVPGILEDEEDGDLESHLVGARERDGGAEAKELAHGVEEPDLRELDGEMGEKDEKGTLPLFPGGGNFVLAVTISIRLRQIVCNAATYRLDLVAPEPGNHIDYDPRQRASKVDDLVHDEGHDARGENIVLHVGVPSQPHALGVVERDIVLGDLFKRAPVRVLRHRRQNRSRVPDARQQIAVATGGECLRTLR